MDELLKLVLNRLDITWTDEATKQKITNIIENGKSELDRLNGIQNDYNEVGQAQALLISYCVYALENQLDQFKINYRSDLVSFINNGKVKNAKNTDIQ